MFSVWYLFPSALKCPYFLFFYNVTKPTAIIFLYFISLLHRYDKFLMTYHQCKEDWKKNPLLGILWSYHGKLNKIFIYPQLFYFIFGYKRFCIKIFIVYGFFFSWELVLMFSFISALNGYCSTFRDC